MHSEEKKGNIRKVRAIYEHSTRGFGSEKIRAKALLQKHLGVDTLDTRNSDRLDFHEVSVWEVKEALQAAFMAGCEVGIATPAATEADS